MISNISSNWTLPELDVDVVTLVQSEYGSSRPGDLNRLADHLSQLLKGSTASRLVLDVSAVKYAGAGWLGVLAQFSARCRQAGRQLLICGDRLGLLQWINLDGTFADVWSALASCRASRSVWHSRFAMPIPLLNPSRNDRFACRAD